MNALIWIAPLVFLAGFIDSIAGGGGLIALPAYVLAGIPIHVAMGTNKLSSSIGTLTASITFFIHKKIWIKLAVIASSFALVGSYLGSSLALMVSDIHLKTLMVIVLPVMAIFILRKREEKTFTQNDQIPWIKISLITFAVGMYDGFLGPGTGTLLIFGFVSLIGMSYTQASANAKVVNLASGLAAIVSFGLSGNVDIALGLWAALFSILGNVSGSLLAIRFGRKIIQPLLIIVFSLLMVKLLLDVL